MYIRPEMHNPTVKMCMRIISCDCECLPYDVTGVLLASVVAGMIMYNVPIRNVSRYFKSMMCMYNEWPN